MAIVLCVECGNQISDQTLECSKCGFPMKEYIQYVQDQNEYLRREQLAQKRKKSNP